MAPLMLLSTALTAIVTIVGCHLGDGHWWGYQPAHLWGKSMIRLALLPIAVSGRDNLESGQSYVFVANHQGSFDIFIIYGYLCRNFKWMMKMQLAKMPLVGRACRAAHHIFVDRRSASGVRNTYMQARETLSGGMSLVVFPEGKRTWDGRMSDFKKGAFALADELQLPVVPLTINGSFGVMPRSRDMRFLYRRPLSLTIHKPIFPTGKGADNIRRTMDESREAIQSALADQTAPIS